MKKRAKRKISTILNAWVSAIVVSLFLLSFLITFFVMGGRIDSQTWSMITASVEDWSEAVEEMLWMSLQISAVQYASQVGDTAKLEDPASLSKRLQGQGLHGYEFDIVNRDGIIIVSSDPKMIDFDVHKDKKLVKSLDTFNTGEAGTVVVKMDDDGSDPHKTVIYATAAFSDGSGYFMFGMTRESYIQFLRLQVTTEAVYQHIGESGELMVIYGDDIISSFQFKYSGQKVADSGLKIDKDTEFKLHREYADVFGVPSYVMINSVEEFDIVGFYPEKDAKDDLYATMGAVLIIETVLFVVLLVTINIVLRKKVVRNVVQMNDTLTQITEGNFDNQVDVHDSQEFDSLSNGINTTVDRLKDYISEAEARIDADLAMAAAIQSSSLPGVFPKSDQFELFASMHAAKEVGGDFYDFYHSDDHTLVLLIADVSGKSIPGAMFMMRSKATIKDQIEKGLPPAEALTDANKKLCEGNEAEMFVTAWLAYVDLRSGKVRFANAGHNPPVVVHDGKAAFVEQTADICLGEFDFADYDEQTLQLHPGDVLYMYTDGITEAEREDHSQYGGDRLIRLLSINEETEVGENSTLAEKVCQMVIGDIEDYVEGAEQFDDMTMLCFRYSGGEYGEAEK